MNFRRLFYLLIIPILFSSCETDFDINAEWKDITVVYGILNQNDSIHYIRIQKAFLGPGNVMHMAAEPDSNLYPHKLNVVIEEWQQSVLRRTLVLDTVTLGGKDTSGIFFAPMQPVYFVQAQLIPDYSYKLVITNNETGKVISSETTLVSDFSISRPAANTQINFNIPTNPTRIFSWRQAQNAGRYQMLLRFNYLDVYFETNDTIARHVDWISHNVKPGNAAPTEELEIRFDNETFFRMIENQVPIINEVVRVPINVELIFSVAGSEFNTFLEVNEPSSSIVQQKPDYTNIENGLGIFSARYNKTSIHRLHSQTINRLRDMEGYNFLWVPSK